MESSNVVYRSMVMAAAAEPAVFQRSVEAEDKVSPGLVQPSFSSEPTALPRGCGFQMVEDHRSQWQHPASARSFSQDSFSSKFTAPIVAPPEATKATSCWASPQVPSPSVYHFLEFYHAKLDCGKIGLDALANGLRCIAGSLSLQAVYQDSPMAAHCSSLCAGQVGLTVTVLRGTDPTVGGDEEDHEADGPACWIIEVQRRSGDCYAFSNLARQIVHQVEQVVAPKPPHDSPPPPVPRPAPVPLLATRRLPSMSQAAMMEHYLETIAPSDASVQKSRCVDGALLEIIERQLMSDMFHEQRLGLECLVNATDPSKSRCQSCVGVSKALLLALSSDRLPRSPMEDVLGLALGSTETLDKDGPGLAEYANEHSNLALMALANALHAVDSNDVEEFVRNRRDAGVDVLERLSTVASGPDMGRAYHSIVALSAMCDKVPGLCMQLNQEVVRSALQVGQSAPHACLEEASGGLLEKMLQLEYSVAC